MREPTLDHGQLSQLLTERPSCEAGHVTTPDQLQLCQKVLVKTPSTPKPTLPSTSLVTMSERGGLLAQDVLYKYRSAWRQRTSRREADKFVIPLMFSG